MANFTDQYANGYLYLTGVFRGTLTPFNSSLNPIANVAYRHVEKDRGNVEWLASIGLRANVQKYELWTDTLGGYSPDINDIFADSVGILWNVIDVQSSDLVGSNGQPVNVSVLAQRAK